MNMATTLIRGAAVTLKDAPLASGICRVCVCLAGYYEDLRQCRASSTDSASHKPLDPEFAGVSATALPDAIWKAIGRTHPGIDTYPLGEILERAVKKTVTSIVAWLPRPDDGETSPLNRSPVAAILERMGSARPPDHRRRLFELFLTHFFFEIAIDQLRRPHRGTQTDFRYRFHFSKKEGRLLSLAGEQSLRRTLARQCVWKAGRYLRCLIEALAAWPDDTRRARLVIRRGFRKWFGVNLPAPRTVKERTQPNVNVVIGQDLSIAASSAPELQVGRHLLSRWREQYAIAGNSRQLLHSHPKANVGLPNAELKEFLGRKPQTMVQDLVELGVAVYLSDLYTRRGRNLARTLSLLTPVRHPSAWNTAMGPMIRTIALLGRDRMALHLVKHPESARPFRPRPLDSDRRCVCLFSGGLDSTAGAVWALENDLRPIFVSQYANARLGAIQKLVMQRLYEVYDRSLVALRITPAAISRLRSLGVPADVRGALKKLNRDRPIMVEEIRRHLIQVLDQAMVDEYLPVIVKYGRQLQHLGLYVSKPRNTAAAPNRIWRPLGNPAKSVMAQHLRSFLFLCLAAAVALEQGIPTIYVFENGPVALNPLYSEARVNTRTTHPHVLAAFSDWIEAAFGVSLTIENPFLYMTKGEVAGILAKPSLWGVLALTDSCWNWFRIPLLAQQAGMSWCRETHDGECTPCLIRRAAVHRAGLDPWDTHYLTDIFTEYPHLPPEVILQAADYVRFCHAAKSLPDADLLHYAPDFSVAAAGIDCGRLIDMYRQHACEVSTCFHDRGNPALRRDFHAILTDERREAYVCR